MKKLVIAGLMTIALSLCAGLAFAADVSAAGAGIAQWRQGLAVDRDQDLAGPREDRDRAVQVPAHHRVRG